MAEDKQVYRERTEVIGKKYNRGAKSVEELWKNLKNIVHESMIVGKARKIGRRKIGYKDWWDRNCMKEKRALHRLHGNWKRGKISREKYIIGRKKWKEWLGEKQKEWRRQEEAELRNLRNTDEV